jgi:hypothetical protein
LQPLPSVTIAVRTKAALQAAKARAFALAAMDRIA